MDIYKHNFKRNLTKSSTFSYAKKNFQKRVICKYSIVQVLNFNPLLKFKIFFIFAFMLIPFKYAQFSPIPIFGQDSRQLDGIFHVL